MQKTTFIVSLLLTVTLQIQAVESDYFDSPGLSRQNSNSNATLQAINSELLAARLTNIQDNYSFIPLPESLRSQKRKRAGTITPSSQFCQPQEISAQAPTPSLYNALETVPNETNSITRSTQNIITSVHTYHHAYHYDFPGSNYHA